MLNEKCYTGNHRFRTVISFGAVVLILFSVLYTLFSPVKTEAASKKYGVVISGSNGKYTFYDLNETDKNGSIETTSTGNVMVPLKKLSSLMPAISCRYDSKTKKATLKNTVNGRRVVYSSNSKVYYYYPNTKSKGVKKTMPYKMYLSDSSSSVMVHMSSLQWVMGTTAGYKYYKIPDMQSAGYDTFVYSGLVVYNPYQKIASIPKSTNVNGISQTVRVTIPEGYSVAQVFNLLVKKGVCASADFLYDALESCDYGKYSLTKAIEPNENRCFIPEGYLYPDTYEFYRLSKGTTVIDKILKNTENRITQDIRTKAADLGYSVDEILTVASLIEKEAGDTKSMPVIASVIYNRLNKPMQLQLDCTIHYIELYVKPYISGDINRYNAYYNTYKCSALPAGPICNPGMNAIQAALNPSETEYYYFYSDPDRIYHYAATYEEIAEIQAKYTKAAE